MIELTVNGKKYKVPGKYEEITLRHAIVMSEADPEDDGLTILSKFVPIPIEDLRQLPLKQKEKEIEFFITQMLELWKEVNAEDLDMSLVDAFTLGKEKFIVPKDLGNQIIGQWQDANKIAKDHQNNLTKFIPWLCAIYCLKEGEQYNGGVVQERAQGLMLELPYFIGLKIHTFFLLRSKEYKAFSRQYFQEDDHMKNQLLVSMSLIESMENMQSLSDSLKTSESSKPSTASSKKPQTSPSTMPTSGSSYKQTTKSSEKSTTKQH